MSKLAKKFATIATVITVLAMVVGPIAPAQALTSAELQAQIVALQAQLAALTTQLGTGTPATTPSVPAGCTFARNLKQGMSGADVKCLQQVLNSDVATQIAATGVGAPGSETMYFGGLTKVAVSKYQVKQGIVAVGTGFVGTLTRAKLNAGGTVTPPTGGVTPPVVTGVVNASLASDNPVADTIVSDAGGSQALIPMLKVNLSNGTASPINVTSMKFTRGGISADSDISQAYIYDGDTKIADYSSFSQSVLSFNSAALFTIPANSVKTITLKVDLANGTAAGKTIKFGINAVTDIVSNASSIGGTFPISGNNMSTALVTDLGELDVVHIDNIITPDPGTGIEVMKFSLGSTNQKLEVRKLVFSNIGTVAYTDIVNFQLFDGATLVVGSGVASANSDKTVVMNLSTPLVIEKGITKNIILKADVVAGTNRTYKFSFQNMSDIVVYDAQYKVFLKPNQSDSWTILNGDEATISSGKVTISRATDSPSGNIAASATNVVLAKYKIKAAGEDVKITSLTLRIYGSIATVGMYQTSIYYDGSQIGQTTTTMNSGATVGATDGTVFSFGNTFVIPAGQEKIIEVRTDVKTSAGGALTSGVNLTAQVGTFVATGKTSSATVTISSADGYQLTVSTGVITVTKSQSTQDWTADNPTAVAGATEVLIGSFVIKAGSGENSEVTGITLQWTTTSNDSIQNIKLYKGTKTSGVQLGSTQGTVVAATDYTFYPSPYVALAVNESFTLNVYADVLTGADASAIGKITMGIVQGTGKATNTSVNSVGTKAGQVVWISAGGALTITLDPATPATSLVLMGATGVELARFRYDASSSPEDILITQIIASTTLAASGAPTSTLSNITLTGTGLSATADSLDENGLATFDLSANPWVIPAGTDDRVLIIKADINSYPYASSSSYIQVGMATTTYKGAMVGTLTSIGGTSIERLAGNAQYIYKTKPTVSLVTQVGNTLTNSTIELMRFKVAADAKGAVNLYGINLGVSLLDIATSTLLKLTQIGLYEVGGSGSALNDWVDVATTTDYYHAYSSSTITASSVFGGNVGDDPISKVGNIKLTNTAGGYLKQISAGGTVEFAVKATVGGAASVGDSVTVKLDNLSTAQKNAFVWGDGLTVQQPSTYVKTVPTDTWSYSVK